MTDPLDSRTPEAFEDSPLEVLEDDENIPPRPEEEIADEERVPDLDVDGAFPSRDAET